MRKNLAVLPLLAFNALIAPLHAIAQTQQQPSAPPQNYYWPGPWHNNEKKNEEQEHHRKHSPTIAPRFAKGEIQKEEYNDRKTEILSGAHSVFVSISRGRAA